MLGQQNLSVGRKMRIQWSTDVQNFVSDGNYITLIENKPLAVSQSGVLFYFFFLQNGATESGRIYFVRNSLLFFLAFAPLFKQVLINSCGQELDLLET